MAFFIFIIYIILSFFRPIELFFPELNEYRPMLVVSLLALFLALGRFVARMEIAASPTQLKLVGGFCIAIILSQVFSGWMGGVIFALNEFSISLMLFTLVVLNVTTEKRLHTTIVVFVLSMTLAAIFSINAFHTGDRATQLVMRQGTAAMDDVDRASEIHSYLGKQSTETVPSKDKSGFYIWRIRGLSYFNDPNDFAQSMVAALALAWALLPASSKTKKIILTLPVSFILGYGIYLTHSRGALIGITVTIFFVLNKILGTGRSILISTIILIGIALSNDPGGREFSTQESSAEGRIDAWQIGLTLLRAHPLTGVGYSRFVDYNALTAHNSYVLCMAELGLIGYFFWLGLIVLTFKLLFKITENSNESGSNLKSIIFTLQASLIGFFTCAWFLSRTYSPQLYFLIALGVAGSWIGRPGAPLGTGNTTAIATTWKLSTTIAMALSIIAVYAFIVAHRLKIS